MIHATLCSTNCDEAWAANVDFEVNGAVWVLKLNTQYAHYKNLLENNKVVIVYKTPDFEIIGKGTAELAEPTHDQFAVASISLNWLRLVEDTVLTDYTNGTEIEQVINSRI